MFHGYKRNIHRGKFYLPQWSQRPTRPSSKNPHNVLPLRPALEAFHDSCVITGGPLAPSSHPWTASQRSFPGVPACLVPSILIHTRTLGPHWCQEAACDSRMQPRGQAMAGPESGSPSPHSYPAHGKCQYVDQKSFLGLSSPPRGWGLSKNCRRRPVLRHKDHGKPGHVS